MTRRKLLGLAGLLLLAGCQTGPEPIKLPPLPADGQPVSYHDIVMRARTLATSATEAFYIDHWADVESAAGGLEQTALFLPKAVDVPAGRKPNLESQATALQQEAQQLRAFARQTDEKKTNEALQRIHLRVRELRPE